MNIRERILAALNWEEPDQVPLLIYDFHFPRGFAERLLREGGVGLVLRPPAHQVEHRQVEIDSREYWESGRKFIRKTYRTPVGDIWQTLVPESAYDTGYWIQDHFIKEPDDYRVIEFVLEDVIYHDNYEFINEVKRRIAGDGLVYVRVAKVPVQEMLYQIMGLERYSLDYHLRRDLFDSLHNCMLKKYDELINLAAEAPVEIIMLGDNITSDMIGEERYRNYCMPFYKRFRDKLSGTEKKTSVAYGRKTCVHKERDSGG
jgi:hypothetical protein